MLILVCAVLVFRAGFRFASRTLPAGSGAASAPDAARLAASACRLSRAARFVAGD